MRGSPSAVVFYEQDTGRLIIDKDTEFRGFSGNSARGGRFPGAFVRKKINLHRAVIRQTCVPLDSMFSLSIV